MSQESSQPPSNLTRAQRLMAQSLAAQQASQSEKAAPRTRKRAPRPGDAARQLNKKIRDVLREQTQEVYGAAPEVAPDVSTQEVSKSPSWEDLADEIAPINSSPRGLATGAFRGRKPSTIAPVKVWLPEPQNPRAILGAHHSPEDLLHEALCGEEKFCEQNGLHYLLARNACDYDACFSELSTRLESVLRAGKFPTLANKTARDLLFVDIETTGLSSGQPLFLVGALRFDVEPARLDLFLARDYPEEKALLAAFHQIARGKSLVTFNGKSFDWPYIEGRSRMYRLDFEQPPAHFDLLHHARRQWKHSLPNCKLQTLELYLCGRTRVDDVAGRDIPRTYHQFVREHAERGTGAHLMSPVLHHNALDILTMAELFCLAGEED